MTNLLIFLIPIVIGLLIVCSGVDNGLIKALGYLLIALFGAGLILMII